MGICLDTGKNGFVNGIATSMTPTSYRSWPPDSTYVNGQRLSVQERTMSEPIMSSRDNLTIIPAPGSGPGPGPPHKVALSMKAHSIRTQEIADIPVIFVLGGPGSGKATYCQRLIQMDPKLVHVNMLPIFVEKATELGSKDPNSVPAYKALELTVGQLLEVKKANGIVVTGYPRNMRDVVEYMAKVQRVDGVILLDWSDRSLERQVKMGARNANVDQQLARFELDNHRANIIPVAQFFDQQGYLHLVAGEREPAEIFDDLAEEIGGILAYPSGSFRDMNRPASQDSDRTRAEVHLPDGGPTRRNSVNSVDRMIEEEMQSQFPAQPIKISEVDDESAKKSNNNEQLASNIVVPKDVEDILRLVRSDTILQRANSSHPIEN